MIDFDVEIAVYGVVVWAVVSGVLADRYSHENENFWQNWSRLFAACIAALVAFGAFMDFVAGHFTLVAWLIAGFIALIICVTWWSNRRRAKRWKSIMTNKGNLVAGICALCFLPTSALAETYISLSALALLPATSEVRWTVSGEIDLTTDTGFGVLTAFGVAHANGHRTELELGYRRTGTHEFKADGGYPLIRLPGASSVTKSAAPASGDISTSSLMLNHYGTFGEGEARPYLGAGIGVAIQALDVLTVDNVLQHGGADGIEDALDDETVVAAWQAMAGIEYRGMRLGYRFFQTAPAAINGFDVAHYTHAIELGIFF